MVAYQQAAPTRIDDDALVENRITGLLSQDNPYMEQAEARGQRSAQRRGLLSGTIATGAVERERIAAALPIAQQDAQTMANADMQDSAYGQQASLNDQGYNQQLDLNQQEFGFNTQLADQQYDNNRGLADQQYGHNRGLADQQYGHNSQLSAQGHEQNSAMSSQEFGQNTQLNAQQNTARMEAERQSQIAASQQNANAQIAAIERDPNLSPEAKQSNIRNILSLNAATIQAIRTGETVSVTDFTYGGQPAQSTGDSVISGQDGGNPSDRIYRSDPTRPNDPPFRAPPGMRWVSQRFGQWTLEKA